jgi:uncharacterized cupredoxin-like copper-binding protein
MRFARLIFVFVVLACLAAAPGRAGATTFSNVGVTETEYHVTLGRTTVPHGGITFSIANFGQDDHNLKVARHRIAYAFSGRIAAGDHTQLTVTLPRGTYNVFCSIPGHRSMGMLQKLVVT